MIALPQRPIATGKLWFESLPTRTRQIVIAVTAGIVVIFLLAIVVRWHHHAQPDYVLEVLDGINSTADVQRESEFLTPQGREIILWTLSKRGDKPASAEKSIYSSPVINGKTCDIPVRQGNTTGTVRLLKTDHWRFNDMYIDKANDKSIGLWASYMKDHPIGTWWSIHGDDMFGAFCQGVLLGARVAR